MMNPTSAQLEADIEDEKDAIAEFEARAMQLPWWHPMILVLFMGRTVCYRRIDKCYGELSRRGDFHAIKGGRAKK